MAGSKTFLVTSESVNEGHPDKLCDQISDVGLDADHCKVVGNIEQQSPDIAPGVHGHFTKKPEEMGAGDQGHIDETEELMPLSHVLATQLGAKLTEVRKNGTLGWLRPDGKTQVTVEYRNDGGAMVALRVHTVLISTQHDETVTNDQIAADLRQHVIKPVIPEKYLDENTIFHLNPLLGKEVVALSKGSVGESPRPVVICGPSGVGKGTLISKLMKEYPNQFGFSVSHTTRKPRHGEQDGVHYHFTQRAIMEKDVREGKFLESADVHGNLYGTSIAAVEDVADAGKRCILDIDVQGAELVKKSPLDALFIFISPPTFQELEARLRGRGTETEEQIQKRLKNAKAEMDRSSDATLFDHLLVNDNLDDTYRHLKKLLGLETEAVENGQDLPVVLLRQQEGCFGHVPEPKPFEIHQPFTVPFSKVQAQNGPMKFNRNTADRRIR